MARRPPGPAPREPSITTPACGLRCEVGDALRLVSKAHVLDVLHLLSQGRALRFGELRETARVNANVLSLRLRDLAAAGLVVRSEASGAGAAVWYEATPMGRDLLEATAPLRAWAARHAPPAAPEPARATG